MLEQRNTLLFRQRDEVRLDDTRPGDTPGVAEQLVLMTGGVPRRSMSSP